MPWRFKTMEFDFLCSCGFGLLGSEDWFLSVCSLVCVWWNEKCDWQFFLHVWHVHVQWFSRLKVLSSRKEEELLNSCWHDKLILHVHVYKIWYESFPSWNHHVTIFVKSYSCEISEFEWGLRGEEKNEIRNTKYETLIYK